MTDDKTVFLSRLSALAKLSEAVLSKEIVELYDKILSTVGYPNATRAVEHIIINRSARDKFPSIADIRRIATGEGDETDTANAVAGRIFEAIKAMDSCRLLTQNVETFLGDIAWRVVVQSGGWDFVYNSMNERNAGTFRAQYRDLALSMIRRNKLGHDLNAAPTFGIAVPGREVQKLLTKTTEQIGGTNE
jgi:hypothetical protein